MPLHSCRSSGFWALDVIEVLESVGAEIGLPNAIRVAQSSEFIARDLCACQHDVTLDFWQPGNAQCPVSAICAQRML